MILCGVRYMEAAEVDTAERGRVPPKPERGVRKIVTIDHKLWRAIDDLRFRVRIKTDQDILVRLIRRGLEAEGVEVPDDGDEPARPEAPTQGRGPRGRR